jgi:hypothetical protein
LVAIRGVIVSGARAPRAPLRTMPALLTSTSKWPCSSRAVWMMRSGSPAVVMSAASEVIRS